MGARMCVCARVRACERCVNGRLGKKAVKVKDVENLVDPSVLGLHPTVSVLT